MSKRGSGLHWKKIDLHVHTPASKDYSGPAITPSDFVGKVREAGLDAIAVTDHNSAGWIDRLKEAARGTGVTIVPGVEISVSGGERGLHIIALFDPSRTAQDVENLLATVGFKASDYGKLEALSQKSAVEVVQAIRDADGLAILAHADSSKGAMNDMKGAQRTTLFGSEAVSAVELVNPEKHAVFLTGKDPGYPRRLAYYRASDNPNPHGGHAIEGVGVRHTFFRLEEVTAGGLDQCFKDPDVRIRCDLEGAPDEHTGYPRVLSLESSGGFLAGTVFEFHSGLNSIIGGKGVGKSLLVELLRFALMQTSGSQAIKDDAEGKLESQLGSGNHVDVRVQLADGKVLQIARTFDGQGNAAVVVDEATGTVANVDVPQLFPMLAYSQTEALEIARDSHAQLRLIDSFLDHATVVKQMTELRARLLETDVGLAKALDAAAVVAERKKTIETIAEQLKQVNRFLKAKEHQDIAGERARLSYIEACDATLTETSAWLESARDGMEDLESPEVPSGLAGDAEVKALTKEMAELSVALKKALDGADAKIGVLKQKLKQLTARGKLRAANAEEGYKQWVGKQGDGSGKQSSTQAVLTKRLDSERKALKSSESAAEGLAKIEVKRGKLLQQLDECRRTLYDLRRAKYAEIQALADGRLRLGIVQGGNREPYEAYLRELKKGSNLHDSTMRAVSEKVGPAELVKVVRADASADLAKRANIDPKAAAKLVSFLRAIDDFARVLRMEHEDLCGDAPSIEYCKADGKYYPLAQLSIGQKCTALLIIALVEGDRPVIIDQPEDALDIRSVFEDITLKMRRRKGTRQFIVTTHNPTVAVAGDTDQFHVLEATSEAAKVAVRGAMDREIVRDEVIQHLEGGVIPFDLKSKKYRMRPAVL